MQPLSYFVPFFLLFFLVFTIWNLFEHSRFTRFEGNLKRGVKIWAEPLPWETRQWLEMMPADFQDKQGFIRKEVREVLILAKSQPLWGIFSRRSRWPYVGYVNLSNPDKQLEFRLPWSTLTSTLLVPILFFPFIFFIFSGDGSQFFLFCFIFPVFLVMIAGSVWFNHYQERKRLLDFLNWAMRPKNQ